MCLLYACFFVQACVYVFLHMKVCGHVHVFDSACARTLVTAALLDIHSALLMLSGGSLPGIFTASPLCMCVCVCVCAEDVKTSPED